MSHTHDSRVDSLRSRLLCADLDLLAAIPEGDAALDSFHGQFDTLLREFEHLQSIGLVDDLQETAVVAASRVASISQLFDELDNETHVLGSTTAEEIESIFADLSIFERSPKDRASASASSVHVATGRTYSNDLHDGTLFLPYALKNYVA